MGDLYALLAREYKMGYGEVLNLPDEVFHMYSEKIFVLLSKQVGMSTYGYDFRSEEEKAVGDFLANGVGGK